MYIIELYRVCGQLGGWKFLIEKAILDGALQNTFMFKMRLFISRSSFLVYTMC